MFRPLNPWVLLPAVAVVAGSLEPARALGAIPAPVRFAGRDVELVVSSVDQRVVRVEINAATEPERAPVSTPDTVLVPFPSRERLRVRQLSGERRLSFGSLRVAVRPSPLTVSVSTADGRPVQELVFEEPDTTNGAIVFQTAAPVLGLGEGAHQFDRRGAFYPMLNGQRAPFLATHGGTIPVPFLIGTDGWALFVHRPWGEFDLREARGRFRPRLNGPERPLLDCFLIAVAEPADTLAEYVRLTGRPVMPPKWVLGYFQSHRTLADPGEPLRIAQTFREKKLPCDTLIYLGTGYCPSGWNTGHGSLEFNPAVFDRPSEQLRALHDLNFKVVLHINHAPRELFGGSMAEENSSPWHIRNYWARHRPDVALGVDGWWPDDGDELPLEARLTRHRCYYEGPLSDRPAERPWSLHRNGAPGAQRYGGWIWSGDVDSRWATLAAHVPVGLNHSLSLTPFWGTDTGGFIPTPEFTSELYVRWFQFSAFTPLFRSHGRTWKLRLPWGWDTGETGPVEARVVPEPSALHHPEVEGICRRFLELRYRLLPYNYTLAREACDTGVPPMRALWLHYPHDPEAVKLGDEYLWGRELLIAPVVEAGARMRRVYLPAGVWYDWWTGERRRGPAWVERAVDLATIPIYARAGAIVPLDPVRQFTGQPVTEPTVIRVYPGAAGTFTLYDDDGHTLGYRDGSDRTQVWIRFRWDDAARRLQIASDDRMKRWPDGVRAFTVDVAGAGAEGKAAPPRVEFRGQAVTVKL